MAFDRPPIGSLKKGTVLGLDGRSLFH